MPYRCPPIVVSLCSIRCPLPLDLAPLPLEVAPRLFHSACPPPSAVGEPLAPLPPGSLDPTASLEETPGPVWPTDPGQRHGRAEEVLLCGIVSIRSSACGQASCFRRLKVLLGAFCSGSAYFNLIICLRFSFCMSRNPNFFLRCLFPFVD